MVLYLQVSDICLSSSLCKGDPPTNTAFANISYTAALGDVCRWLLWWCLFPEEEETLVTATAHYENLHFTIFPPIHFFPEVSPTKHYHQLISPFPSQFLDNIISLGCRLWDTVIKHIPRFPPFLRDQPRGLWLCSFPRFPHIWPISSFPRDPTQCYVIRLISWFPHNSPFPRGPTYRFITLISPFSRAPSRRSISSMSSYLPIYNEGYPSADFLKFHWLPHFSRPHPETLT